MAALSCCGPGTPPWYVQGRLGSGELAQTRRGPLSSAAAQRSVTGPRAQCAPYAPMSAASAHTSTVCSGPAYLRTGRWGPRQRHNLRRGPIFVARAADDRAQGEKALATTIHLMMVERQAQPRHRLRCVAAGRTPHACSDVIIATSKGGARAGIALVGVGIFCLLTLDGCTRLGTSQAAEAPMRGLECNCGRTRARRPSAQVPCGRE